MTAASHEDRIGSGPGILAFRLRVLSLEHISKTYPGTRALVDVSFDAVGRGTHCLIGENGVGKSTLMKILAGVVQPDQGAIVLRGRAYPPPDATIGLGSSASAPSIEELDIITSLTVADNVFLGQEPKHAHSMSSTLASSAASPSQIYRRPWRRSRPRRKLGAFLPRLRSGS